MLRAASQRFARIGEIMVLVGDAFDIGGASATWLRHVDWRFRAHPLNFVNAVVFVKTLVTPTSSYRGRCVILQLGP